MEWCPSLKFDHCLGRGAFGTAFKCTYDTAHGPRQAALKVELGSSHGPSCLEYEALVYRTHGSSVSRDHENPVPLIVKSLSSKNTDFFMTIPLETGDAVRILSIELVDLAPQEILKSARTVFVDNGWIEASFRYMVLKLLYASLYSVQHGVVHLDLKEQHLAYRRCSRQMLFLDWGLSEMKGKVYKDPNEMKGLANKRRKSLDQPFFGLQIQGALPQFAHDNPGTPGSQPPFKLDGKFEGSCRANIWQVAVIILELFLPVPYIRTDAESYQQTLYQAVLRCNFEKFMRYALGDKPCPSDSCRQCLELVYNLFQDAQSKQEPVAIITRALISEFALCYIAETAEMDRLLTTEGIVVDGRMHEGERIQRPLVMLKARKIGLLVFSLLDSKEGDIASPYAGRIVQGPSGNILSSANFIMHGLPLGNGHLLDGQPCEDLPLSTLVSAGAVGSLFVSSRIDPDKDLPGNIGLPNRLGASALKRQTVDGVEFDSVDMIYRTNTRYGQPCAWSYKWGNGGGSVAIPKGMVEACKRRKGRIDDLMYGETLDIVMKRRLEILGQGKFKDADWGQCRCDRWSLSRSAQCRFHTDFAGIVPYTPQQRPEKGKVWVSPSGADPSEIEGLTVSVDPFNLERFDALIAGKGASLVSGFSKMSPESFEQADRFARDNADSLCRNSVFIYPSENGTADVGRGEKKLGYLNPNCETALYMLEFLKLVRPGFQAMKAAATRGKSVDQLELIRQLIPREGRRGEVQVYHTDATVDFLPGSADEDGGVLRSNLQAVLDGRGPLSLFFSFDDDYYVTVYLTGHILVIECMKHLCRHYNPAKFEYFKQYPDTTDEQFRGIWCAGTVQYIREFYPKVQLEPVCIPVKRGDVLAISAFLPHCGPPVPGIRGFMLAGPKVLSCTEIFGKTSADLLTD